MIYNIDFDKLAEQLLPPFLRKVRMLAWVKLLLYPLRYLNDLLLEYIEKIRLEISYNGQTIVLERALNNQYPAASNGIWIDNNVTLLPRQFVFFESENQGDAGFAYYASEGLGDYGFTYFSAEYASDADFIVIIPDALVFDLSEMIAYINKYKIAGKRYEGRNYSGDLLFKYPNI